MITARLAPPVPFSDLDLWEDECKVFPCEHCEEQATWIFTVKPCGCIALLCHAHLRQNQEAIAKAPRATHKWMCTRCKASADAVDFRPL